MSHVPLLSREYRDLPRLPPPRRGPQICICVTALFVLGLFLVFDVRSAFDSVHVAHKNATQPPEAQRMRALATAVASGVQFHATDLAGPTLHDLIVAVGYLLEEKSEAR